MSTDREVVPQPPEPMIYPNAEWCEAYARWHSRFGPANLARAQAIEDRRAAALRSSAPAVPADVVEALRAIAEGYPVRGEQDRYVVVENPSYKPDNMSDPNLVIDLDALTHAKPEEPASPARAGGAGVDLGEIERLVNKFAAFSVASVEWSERLRPAMREKASKCRADLLAAIRTALAAKDRQIVELQDSGLQTMQNEDHLLRRVAELEAALAAGPGVGVDVDSLAASNWSRAMKAESRLEWAEGRVKDLEKALADGPGVGVPEEMQLARAIYETDPIFDYIFSSKDVKSWSDVLAYRKVSLTHLKAFTKSIAAAKAVITVLRPKQNMELQVDAEISEPFGFDSLAAAPKPPTDDPTRTGVREATEPVDIQQIIFSVCERNNGGCACKLQRTNLARWDDGPRGARCDERYDVALAVICAIAKANAALKSASGPDRVEDDPREVLFRLKTECEVEGLDKRAGFDCWVSWANRVLGDYRPPTSTPDQPSGQAESEREAGRPTERDNTDGEGKP